MSILRGDVEISSSCYVLQVSLSSGMSGGSMKGGVGCGPAWLGRYWGRGSLWGGCDIGVVSMVLTLGLGLGGAWVCGVSLFDVFSFLFGAIVLFSKIVIT